MANELTIAGGDNKLALPAHIAARFKPEDSNIIPGDSTPTLGIKGKVFTITANGESTQLLRADDEGNEYPLAALPVVILDYAAKTGRSYYETDYNPDEVKEPNCYSLDGVVPEPDAPDLQSEKCANCPMAVKGSKVTDNGKAISACSVHRILAVVPVKRMDLPPLRLRIAQTSNYDGRSPELKAKGQFAFQNYLDAIRTRGVPHTQSIVTTLSFDTNVAYPKLLFRAVRFLDDPEIAKVDAILATGKVGEILGRTGTMALKANPALAAPAAVAALPKPKATAPAADDEDAQLEALLAKRAAKKAAEEKAAHEAKMAELKRLADAKAAAEAAAAAAAAGGDEGEDDEDAQLNALLAKRAAKKAAAEAAAAAAAKPKKAETEDELLDRLLAERAAKKAGKAAPAKAPDEEDEDGDEAAAPVAEPAKPTRIRRTKAQIEADAAAAAAPKGGRTGPATEDEGEKFVKTAIGDLGGEDEGDLDEPAPAKPAAKAAAKATAKPTEAVAKEIPPDVNNILQSWDD